jgi:hypothetical protein
MKVFRTSLNKILKAVAEVSMRPTSSVSCTNQHLLVLLLTSIDLKTRKSVRN